MLGHGGTARLEVAPTAVPAGQTVTIRGVDLGGSGRVSLALVGADGGLVGLGAIEGDAENGFEISLAIPATTHPGAYALRATLTDGDHLDAPLVVEAAVAGTGEQRPEEEALLGPMPSAGSGVGSQRASASARPADPRPDGGSSDPANAAPDEAPTAAQPVPATTPTAPLAVGVVLVVGLGSLVLLVLGLARSRSDPR